MNLIIAFMQYYWLNLRPEKRKIHLMQKEAVLLPGMSRQPEILIDTVKEEIKKVLIMGPGTIHAGMLLRDRYGAEVFQIVEDEDSLLTDRLRVKGEKDITVRMMDYTSTDFKKEFFDMVYAQASISEKRRSRIIKEVKRVLKDGGIFCMGEITNLSNELPPFITDMMSISGISPLKESEIIQYYTGRNFELLADKDLQSTLTEYYSRQSELLPGITEELAEHEKSYYKKLLNRMSHESNVYLKLGGDKYIGYRMLILRKTAE